MDEHAMPYTAGPKTVAAGSELSAVVRRVIGWRVGEWSRSGIGHYYAESLIGTARALCGDEWNEAFLQGEDQIIKRCKRCENSLDALEDA